MKTTCKELNEIVQNFNGYMDYYNTEWESVAECDVVTSMSKFIADCCLPFKGIRSVKYKGATQNNQTDNYDIESCIVGPKGFGIIPGESRRFGRQRIYADVSNLFWFIQPEVIDIISSKRKRELIYDVIQFRTKIYEQITKLNSQLKSVPLNINVKTAQLHKNIVTDHFTDKLIKEIYTLHESNRGCNVIAASFNISCSPAPKNIKLHNQSISAFKDSNIMYFHPKIHIAFWDDHNICVDNCIFTCKSKIEGIPNRTLQHILNSPDLKKQSFNYIPNHYGIRYEMLTNDVYSGYGLNVARYSGNVTVLGLILLNYEDLYNHPQVKSTFNKIVDLYKVINKTADYIKNKYIDLKFLNGKF